MADESDQELVERIQAGDEHAYGALFERHRKHIYDICRRKTTNIEDASDLTQETALRAFRFIGGFRRDCKFSTWLGIIAASLCNKHYTSGAKFPAIVVIDTIGHHEEGSVEIANSQSPVEDKVVMTVGLEELRKKIGQRNFEVFMLHEVEGLTYAQIAIRHQISETRVKQVLMKSIRAAQAIFTGDIPE